MTQRAGAGMKGGSGKVQGREGEERSPIRTPFLRISRCRSFSQSMTAGVRVAHVKRGRG